MVHSIKRNDLRPVANLFPFNWINHMLSLKLSLNPVPPPSQQREESLFGLPIHFLIQLLYCIRLAYRAYRIDMGGEVVALAHQPSLLLLDKINVADSFLGFYMRSVLKYITSSRHTSDGEDKKPSQVLRYSFRIIFIYFCDTKRYITTYTERKGEGER